MKCCGFHSFTFFSIYVHKGMTDIDKTRKIIQGNQEISNAEKKGWKIMKKQENEFVKSFSYWPTPNKRTGGNIYDIRSYRGKRYFLPNLEIE